MSASLYPCNHFLSPKDQKQLLDIIKKQPRFTHMAVFLVLIVLILLLMNPGK